ncbi:4Fe-4S binding protein [Geobacter sulfurreducens subsp. ethanolicus]|uniref:FeS-binding protein n=1 Tax=Geomobilimonas luticola TaxID=1114878 RepID=A0ABS5SAY3_9BACT|nr:MULTISPECIES: FeS-binding protein [Geobacteraceae]MBT0652511.1 FeS-binding protein [Geomobilimonas luticola]BEH08979.1 4Fe-4S binding protein [Geobacter sulfurreducens subsp. ethanolicus]
MLPKTYLIYFSPTRTTRKIVEQVAAGLDSQSIEHHDLTRMEQEFTLRLDDGVAVIGVPVYAGRVPEIFLKRIEKLSGEGIPAVLIALYGNRAYEDALVELRDVIIAKGFNVVAAGAFIGEHSYSTDGRPIAANRPDTEDLKYAIVFGVAIANKLQGDCNLATLDIPGNIPYKERVPLGGICPETMPELCTLCKTCARICPAFIITVDQEVTTKAENCVMCCACVKFCPYHARVMRHPMVEARRDMLIKNCSERKEPSCFL